MTPALLQDVAVTIVALGATLVLVRNALAMFRPSRSGSACRACGPACATSQSKTPAATVVPLRLVRRHHA